MKQITIYDLLPLLKKGWVAYHSKFGWMWFDKKPKKHKTMYYLDYPHREFVYAPHPFKELAPFDGDWKDSLIRIDHFHQQGKMVKEVK